MQTNLFKKLGDLWMDKYKCEIQSSPYSPRDLQGTKTMNSSDTSTTLVDIDTAATPILPVIPEPARLAPLEESIGESLQEPRAYASSSAINSLHSTSTRASSGGRASLQSGQVNVIVSTSPAVGNRPRVPHALSSSSVISRDLLPTLSKGENAHEAAHSSSLKNAFDWRFFVFVILNPIEYVWPFTVRRAAFWCLYGGIAVGLYFLNKFYAWAPGMAWAFRYQSIIAMSLIYGIEPLFMLLLYLIARLPEANKHTEPTICERCLFDIEQDGAFLPLSPSNCERTALVIACHNTDLVAFFNVLKGAFKHFEAHQIFVVENDNQPHPPPGGGELQAFCKRIDSRINYIWSPIASKNAAQYVGSLAAHQYDFIMTTDDDVVLPWNFRSPTELITEEYKAVCFPIGARVARQQSWAGASSLVVSWQDIEFKASGLIKTAEAQLCGVLYPHGAASFWDRTTFLDALRMHSLVFYGEDTQLGLALQRMGKMIAIDASIILETEVPASFLGPPLNYWQQRVRSWEMGRMSMLFKFFSHLFRINGQRTITGFLAQKILQFYALYSIVCDLIRVPLFVIMYSRPGFWQKYALFSLVPILPPLVYKYIKTRHRPDLEPALIPVLTFPLYKFIYQIVSCLGVLRCIFFYWPSFKHTKTIKEWEKEDIFWLDDQFIQNPGFLAVEEKNSTEKDQLSSKREEKETEKTCDDKNEALNRVSDLLYAPSFDTRSHVSRAMTSQSRLRHTAALQSFLGSGHPHESQDASEKQRRMEQQLSRLEGSMARMEDMLLLVSKRL